MAVVDLSDRELAAWAFGTLEPGDAAWLAAHAGPADRLRAAGLAAWAGVATRTGVPPLRAEGHAAPLLSGPTRLRPGDRITLPLAWDGPLHEARVAVFRTIAGIAERIFPSDDSWATLADFPQRDGHPVADIVLDLPAGEQRFDVVLVHRSLAESPWPEREVWDRLRSAYAAGCLPGVTVSVEVEA